MCFYSKVSKNKTQANFALDSYLPFLATALFIIPKQTFYNARKDGPSCLEDYQKRFELPCLQECRTVKTFMLKRQHDRLPISNRIVCGNNALVFWKD